MAFSTASDSRLYQTRIWIGPPYRPASDPYHFDYTAIQAAPTTYFSDPCWGITLQPMDADSDHVFYRVDGGTLPPVGGIWIEPTSSAEGWEFIEYTGIAANDFTGLLRQPLAEREHNSNHANNARWLSFYPLTDPDHITPISPLTEDTTLQPAASGEIHVTDRLEANGAVVDWSATITGYNLPRHAVRNHHLAVIERRFYSEGGPGSWEVWRLGWLQAPGGSDTAGREAQWSAEIVSIGLMANRYEVDGVDVGPRDIAKDGSASSSEPLAFAYKERDVEPPDFTAADPGFEAGNVIDREGSVWIAEQFVGTHDWSDSPQDYHLYGGAPNSRPYVAITAIYLQRPAGLASTGYRYIELTTVDNGEGTSVKDMRLKVESSGLNHLLDIGEDDVEIGNKIIICEDESLFSEENPVSSAVTFEVPSAVFDSIDPLGDTVALQRENWPYTWSHGVSWGLTGILAANWPANQTANQFNWQGSTQLGAIPPGYALRYVFSGLDGDDTDTDPSNYWEFSNATAPYTIGEYDDDNNWNGGQISPVWIKVDLPEIQLQLAEDWTPTTPANGDLIYLNDASGEASTQGLDDSGYFFVGNEACRYTAKEAGGLRLHGTEGRGALSTPINDHAIEDVIHLRDPDTGLATTAHKITNVAWQRPEGAVYPVDFNIYTTVQPRRRTPNDEDWAEDWAIRAIITGYTDPATPDQPHVYAHGLPAGGVRASSIMYVIYKMSEDPYRPRLNEIYTDLDDGPYDSDTWLNSGESVGDVIRQQLLAVGVPAAAVTLQAGLLAPTGYTVEKGYAWAVCADLADYANARITINGLSQIHVAPNSLWTSGTLTEDRAWDRDDVINMATTQRQVTPIQSIKMEYYTPADDATATIIYPDVADQPADGVEQVVGRQVYADALDATRAAQRRYYFARFPYTAIVEMANPSKPSETEPAAGELIRVGWEFGPDEHPTARYNRLHLVESVDIFVEDNGQVSKTLALTQIGRSSYE